MVRLAAITRRLRTREDGFTLPEVLVAMTMTVTMLFALYAIFDTSVRIFRASGDGLEAVENARLGLERMEREIRAARPRDDGALLGVESMDKSITFENKPDGRPPKTITYGLSGGPSKFLKRNGQKIAGPVSGVDGLRFSYCTSMTDCSSHITDEDQVYLVRVTLKVKASGGATRTLTTDVLLRNR